MQSSGLRVWKRVVLGATRHASASRSASYALAGSRRRVVALNSSSTWSSSKLFSTESSSTFDDAPKDTFKAAEESQEHAQGEQQESHFEDPERRILENALNHVVELGWSTEALAAGAKDAGLPSVAHGMFARGPVELVEYFMEKNHEKVREQLIARTEELQAMTVTDRLKLGLKLRLQLNEPVMPTWPQAMGLGALPPNAPTTLQSLSKLMDEIWYFAGDKSLDYTWYTKRAALLGVYTSTELFMLTDHSENYEATWKFLDRRVDEVIALGEAPQNVHDVVGMVAIGMQAMFSAATSLAGPLGAEIVRNSPLNKVPNPISAVGNVLPTSLASKIPTPTPTPTPTSTSTQQPNEEPIDFQDFSGLEKKTSDPSTKKDN